MSTTVDEGHEVIRGQLAGVLPEARQFEFKTAALTIRGPIDKTVTPEVLATFNRDFLGIDALARLNAKRIKHNGDVVRESYSLLGLERPTVLEHPPATVPET